MGQLPPMGGAADAVQTDALFEPTTGAIRNEPPPGDEADGRRPADESPASPPPGPMKSDADLFKT